MVQEVVTFDLPFGLGGMVSPAAQVALSQPNRAALPLPANGGWVERRSCDIGGRSQVKRHSRSRVKRRSCAHTPGRAALLRVELGPAAMAAGGLHHAIPGRRVILRIAGCVTRFS